MSKDTDTRSWWVFLLWGILAVLFGITAFVMPAKTAVWLLYLIAVFIFVDAVILLFNLIRGKIQSPIKWALWLRAILGLVLGAVVVFFNPILGSLILGLTLVKIMGIQSVIIGLFEVIDSLKHIKGKGWWSVFLGVIWVIFGVILFVWSAESLISLTQVTGIVWFALGIVYIMIGLKSRKA